MPKEQHGLRRDVKAILDRIDPIGLLAMGSPEDEYEEEALDIVQHLSKCTDLSDIKSLVESVFAKAFDQRMDESLSLDIARRIYQIVHAQN